MRKREVIEFRHRIDCMGWPFTFEGHQEGIIVKARL